MATRRKSNAPVKQPQEVPTAVDARKQAVISATGNCLEYITEQREYIRKIILSNSLEGYTEAEVEFDHYNLDIRTQASNTIKRELKALGYRCKPWSWGSPNFTISWYKPKAVKDGK